MSSGWRTWGAVVAAGVAIVVVAIGASSANNDPAPPPAARRATTTAPTTPAAPTSDVPTSAAYTQALTDLTALPTVPRRQPTDYLRSAFGSSWVDTDGNGCNQRDDVLLRDAQPGTARVEQQGRCDHDVVAGTWIDPYTRTVHVMTDMKNLSQAMTVQIDHVVPLAEAWVSGADAWSEDRRKAFANDLDELLAVDGSTNESKSDGDPAAWRPRKSYQCTYAEHWIAVKSKWDLGVDASEATALRQMLTYC